MMTKFVVFRKNGRLYVANVVTMRVEFFDDYDFMADNMKNEKGCRKLVIDGNVEFWGREN